MPSQTPNLDLYKVNGETDGNDTFNVDVVLNDNWDKLDAAVGQIKEDLGNVQVPDASLTQKGIVQLSNATAGTRENVAATEKAVGQAFQAGNERKAEVVAALVAIGIPASTSETWTQLIPKIAAVIRATGNATAADILAGKTASNANGPLTGSMPNRGAVLITPGPSDQAILAGYHNGAGKVAGVPVPAANVLTGTTIAGTPGQMPNRSAENNHMPGLESTVWAGDRFFIRPPHGYYNGSTWVTALVPGLTAANLRAGVNVAGLIGTLQEGVQYATGNIGAMAPMTPINVDCGFVPRIFAWSGLRDDFSVRGSTIKYLTADGIEHSDVGNSIFYIVTSLRQVMTIQNNDSSGRYIRNVIWQAWA
ncbi:phage tail protein [Paenibacillus lautus]|uniref:phage tail protein n=1 Tax=Paenibacillus lautus TaxID=1401 RepID=UPI0039865E66